MHGRHEAVDEKNPISNEKCRPLLTLMRFVAVKAREAGGAGIRLLQPAAAIVHVQFAGGLGVRHQCAQDYINHRSFTAKHFLQKLDTPVKNELNRLSKNAAEIQAVFPIQFHMLIVSWIRI